MSEKKGLAKLIRNDDKGQHFYYMVKVLSFIIGIVVGVGGLALNQKLRKGYSTFDFQTEDLLYKKSRQVYNG